MATLLALNKIEGSNASVTESRRISRPSRPFEAEVLDQPSFVRALRLEHKRTERSTNQFLLVVVDGGERFQARGERESLANIVSAISNSTRETDTLGWYEQGTKLGIVFTEIAATNNKAISKIVERITRALQLAVNREEFESLRLTFGAFPAGSPNQSLPPKAEFLVQPDASERKAKAASASLQVGHAT